MPCRAQGDSCAILPATFGCDLPQHSGDRTLSTDMSSTAPLVLHITNIPTPYRLPYYRTVSRNLEAGGIGFHVFFLGQGKRPREWKIGQDDLHGFPYTLNGGGLSNAYRNIVDAIGTMRPSVVVLAWAMDPLALRILLYCRIRRIPCILFTGETTGTAAGRSYAPIRALSRKPFFWLADGFVTYGTRSTEYLVENGVAPGRISTGLNVVDTGNFRNNVEELRRSGAAGIERDRYRMPDGRPFPYHLLMVNYMIPGKGISSTLLALKSLGRTDVALHIVGSGPREDAHRAMVQSEGMNQYVFFHGYKQTSELFIFYALADLFLFPSSIDVFGLVMAEAAAASLPVIASMHSGGTVDVIDPGVNGLIVDPRATAQYASAIARLLDDPEMRRAMGAAGRDRSLHFLTLEESAERYQRAILRIVGCT